MWVAAAATAAGLHACRPAPRTTGAEPTSADTIRLVENSLEVRLGVPHEAQVGHTVPLRITVRNVSGKPLDLGLVHPNPAEFVVRRARGGHVVWALLGERGGAEAPEIGPPLAPGGLRTIEHAWSQRDDGGRPVPHGEYRVEAVLFAGPPFGDVRVGPARLTIKR